MINYKRLTNNAMMQPPKHVPRMFNPKTKIRFYRDIVGTDQERNLDDYLTEVMAHRKDKSVTRNDPDGVPEFHVRREYWMNKDIKIYLTPDTDPDPLGSESRGSDNLGDAPIQGRPYKILGPNMQDGLIVYDTEEQQTYTVTGVRRLLDQKRIIVECSRRNF